MVVHDARHLPEQLYLDVHMPCNLRCRQCDIWKLRNPPDELSLDERRDLLRDLARWSPATDVYFAGGEVIARRGALFTLIEDCTRLGLKTFFTTNGTLFVPSDFERLVDAGLTCLIFSFDSDDPVVHDDVRGVPGTFGKAMASLEAMMAARGRRGPLPLVITSTIVHRGNVHRLSEIAELFAGMGVDRVSFNPIQPVVKAERGEGWWKGDMFPRDLDAVDRAFDGLVALARQGVPLHQTESQLEDMRRYFHRPWQLEAGHCAAHLKNLMVDARGDVRFCFDMERAGVAPVGNVRGEPLEELWHSEAARRAKQAMAACREGCGALSCHSR